MSFLPGMFGGLEGGKGPSNAQVLASGMQDADALYNKYYTPLDYGQATDQGIAGGQQQYESLQSLLAGSGAQQVQTYQGLTGQAAQAAGQTSQTIQQQFITAMQKIDPTFQQRVGAQGQSVDALVGQANQYLTGEQASALIQTGVVQSQQQQNIVSDMLAGKLPSADLAAQNTRTAETLQSFGVFGNAGSSAAAGQMASTNLISQQNLMMQGMALAPSANSALTGAFNTLAGISGQAGQAAMGQSQLAGQYKSQSFDPTQMYNQNIGAMASLGTQSAAQQASMAMGTQQQSIGGYFQMQDSNFGNMMSLVSGGLNMGMDVIGAQAQAEAAKKAGENMVLGASLQGLGSLSGAGIQAMKSMSM